MSKKLFAFVSLLVLAGLVLTACGTPNVVKDARATATTMAYQFQATAIVGTAVAEFGMEPPATPTLIPAEGVPAQPTAMSASSHDQHLLDLDPIYRSQGWESWLRAAGINFDASKVESRQPVEAVINGHVTVTSLVIRATGMKVNWPACVTTDHPEQVSTSADTRQHQPDLRNASVMYTNVTLNGQGTVYADCSDWGQLDPTE